MGAALALGIRSQLAERRSRLDQLVTEVEDPRDLVRLLGQVDRALDRLALPSFVECAVCNGHFDDQELLDNPLATYCLCDLSDAQQRMLERDLELAWRIQASLLPPASLSAAGWDAHYRYQPLGTIGGDYCDLLPQSAGAANYLYFLMGDVAGKGVAAALLMSHLSATVRSLVRAGAGLEELMLEANRTLRKYSPEAHYMTLVGGRARSDGRVEILNAGHTPPIVLRKNRSESISSTAPPIGLFDRTTDSDAGLDGPQVVELALEPGDTILLYTDGLTEASNAQEEDYGSARLMQLGARLRGSDPTRLVAECLKDLKTFLGGAPRSDDLAVMALRRE